MFYKLIDKTTIRKAPKPLKIDGKDVYTTSEQIYNDNGYYRLEQNEYPQDEKHYSPRYALQGNVIVQSWIEVIIDDSE
jgi:hypothetical protein